MQFWGRWTQNGFWGIIWQQPVRFSHTTLHLIQNFMKKTGLFFIENFKPQRGLGPSIEIWGKGAQNYFFGLNFATTCQIFINNPSFFSKFYDQHFAILFFLKKRKVSITWRLGPGTQICVKQAQNGFWGHNLATTCQIFTNNLSFYSKFYNQHFAKIFF